MTDTRTQLFDTLQRMMRRHLPSIVLFSSLLVVAGAGFAPASAVAAPDPVVTAIVAAQRAGAVTVADAYVLRRDWARSARAARTAPTSSRRQAIATVRTMTLRLAQRGQLVASRVMPALQSVRATTAVMASRMSYPAHEQEVRVPGDVLTYTYYRGAGVQMQPFETFKTALAKLNATPPDVAGARAIADRMMQLDYARDGMSTWEYFFPWNGGPSTPWTSAISQAIALSTYRRVAELVPAAERAPYDAEALAVLQSFLRPISAGGVMVPDGSGAWYSIYPFAPSQRILNGDLQALLDLGRFANATGNADAQRAYDLGVATVKPMRPLFDTGAWSNYQPGQEAELGYHEFQTDLLVKLGREHKDQEFADWGKTFDTYLMTQPTVSLLDTAWLPIIPAKDGFRDDVAVRIAVNKPARVTMVVLDEFQQEQRRVTGWGSKNRPVTLRWNGLAPTGFVAPDGEYHVKIIATDLAGNRGTQEFDAPLITIARDTTPPVLATLALAAKGTRASQLVITASDPESAWIDAQVMLNGARLARARGASAGRIVVTIPKPLATARRATLTLRNASGGMFTQALAQPVAATPAPAD